MCQVQALQPIQTEKENKVEEKQSDEFVKFSGKEYDILMSTINA